jgi:hypothetical protein
LYYPEYLLFAEGDVLLVSEVGNNVVRKVTLSGAVSTFVGNGSATFANGVGTMAALYSNRGMVYNDAGLLYVADSDNNCIRWVTPGGVVGLLAGSRAHAFSDGTGTAAAFAKLYDLDRDSSGNLYVTDSDNNRVRKVRFVPVGSRDLLQSVTASLFIVSTPSPSPSLSPSQTPVPTKTTSSTALVTGSPSHSSVNTPSSSPSADSTVDWTSASRTSTASASETPTSSVTATRSPSIDPTGSSTSTISTSVSVTAPLSETTSSSLSTTVTSLPTLTSSSSFSVSTSSSSVESTTMTSTPSMLPSYSQSPSTTPSSGGELTSNGALLRSTLVQSAIVNTEGLLLSDALASATIRLTFDSLIHVFVSCGAPNVTFTYTVEPPADVTVHLRPSIPISPGDMIVRCWFSSNQYIDVSGTIIAASWPIVTNIVDVVSPCTYMTGTGMHELYNCTNNATIEETLLSLPALPAPNIPFTLAVNGARVLALEGNFTGMQVEVTMSSMPCTILAVSDRYLVVETPSYSVVCGNHAEEDCGLQSLAVTVSFLGHSLTLACPPFCPGVPFEVHPSGMFGTSEYSVTDRTSSCGIYYLQPCQAPYVSPMTGVCTNTSHPDAILCAFGAGDSCSPCLRGAVCPGGFRAWPRAGFWSSGPTSINILPCATPAYRCTGFDIVASMSGCAAGYHGFACSACDAGYYATLTGACDICPPTSFVSAVLVPLLILLGCMIAAGALLMALLRLFRFKGTPAEQAARARDFVVWALMVLQTISQTAVITAETAPSLQSIYGALRMLQFEGIVVNPACLHGPPFQMQFVSLSLLLLLLITVVVAMRTRWVVGAAWGMKLLFIAYSSVSNMTLFLLRCPTVVLSSAAVASLDGAPVASGAVVELPILASNPYFVCYAGSHLQIIPLAWLVIGVYIIGFPAGTALWVWRSLKIQGKDVQAVDRNDAVLAAFTAAYARPNVFFWRHIEWISLFGLSALRTWLQPSPLSASAASNGDQELLRFICTLALLTITISLLVWLRPYKKSELWKLGVQGGVLALSGLIALDNFYHSDTLAIVILCGCLLLIIVLIVSFFSFMNSAAHTTIDLVSRAPKLAHPLKHGKSTHVMINNPMAAQEPSTTKAIEPQRPSFARQGLARQSVWASPSTHLPPVAVRTTRAPGRIAQISTPLTASLH